MLQAYRQHVAERAALGIPPLNILVPLPIWKWYFKNQVERKESLVQEYWKAGIVYRG